jgi:hypothetical protein
LELLLLWENENNMKGTAQNVYLLSLLLINFTIQNIFFSCISAFKHLKNEQFLKIAAGTIVTLHILSKCYVNFTILIISSQITSVVRQF